MNKVVILITLLWFLVHPAHLDRVDQWGVNGITLSKGRCIVLHMTALRVAGR